MRRGTLCILAVLALAMLAASGQAALGDGQKVTIPEVTEAHRAAFAKVKTIKLVLEEDYDKQGETFEVGVREAVTELLETAGLAVAAHGESDAELIVGVSAEPHSAKYMPGGRLWTGGRAEARAALVMGHLPPLRGSFTEEKACASLMMVSTMGSPYRYVSKSPAWSLATHCTSSSILYLLVRLDSEAFSAVLNRGGPKHGVAGVSALARWCDEEALPLLVEALGNESSDVRQSAVGVLAGKGKSAVPVLLAALKDESGHVRAGAAAALRDMEPAAIRATRALIRALEDEDRWVRRNAAAALGNMGPRAREAIQPLTVALGDINRYVRRASANALSKMGPVAEAATPALTDALQDTDEWVRSYAAGALGEIGPAATVAVPALTKLLSGEGIEVRREAAAALGKMGAAASSAVPALEALLQDENFLVKGAAREALKRIRGEG